MRLIIVVAVDARGSNGAGAGWGFLVAIGLAIVAFLVGGVLIAVRARRDYLAMEARRAARPPDEEDQPSLDGS
jgi:hypothetical protein